MKRIFGLLFLIATSAYTSQAQDDLVKESFSNTRVMSNHSFELLPKRSLEFIVAHKFGDAAGATGGLQIFMVLIILLMYALLSNMACWIILISSWEEIKALVLLPVLLTVMLSIKSYIRKQQVCL